LARRVGDLRGMEERLRRDAAAVEAGAAELVLLDEGHRQTQLAGTQGGGIAAAATPEDHDVVGLVVSRLRHGCSLEWRTGASAATSPSGSADDILSPEPMGVTSGGDHWARREVDHFVLDGDLPRPVVPSCRSTWWGRQMPHLSRVASRSRRDRAGGTWALA